MCWCTYNLLVMSCVVSFPWQDIEIRTNASLYLPQISELLNRVPRQMLLLLKTNDLLRGIETTLQTRASSSSFINVSRCCVRALARCASLRPAVQGLTVYKSQMLFRNQRTNKDSGIISDPFVTVRALTVLLGVKIHFVAGRRNQWPSHLHSCQLGSCLCLYSSYYVDW